MPGNRLAASWDQTGDLLASYEEHAAAIRDSLYEALYDGMVEAAKAEEEFLRNICPGCGYGTTTLGIVLVTRPDLVIDPFDERLCLQCRPNHPGRLRLPSDPPSSEFFPPLTH